jgi:hypothetical protein
VGFVCSGGRVGTSALCFRLSCEVESQAISLFLCVQLVEGTDRTCEIREPTESYSRLFFKDL